MEENKDSQDKLKKWLVIFGIIVLSIPFFFAEEDPKEEVSTGAPVAQVKAPVKEEPKPEPKEEPVPEPEPTSEELKTSARLRKANL